MSKEKRRVPKLRFPGFTEDWEQRKLRDLLEQPITDGPHETPELYDSGIPFISVDAIIDNKIDFTKMRGYISKAYDDICARKYKPQINDVYLVKSGATIGKVAIVDTYDDFNIWSPLAAMRCGKITHPYFLYVLLQTKDLQSQVFNKASHGTQPNLSMRQLEKFTCKVPKIEEQILIGHFFKQLNESITLHQRKLDNLKLKKKALLQKLFPKNGERYPELRFPGFTDAWEQRKLNEFLSVSNLKNTENKYNKKDVLSVSGDYGIVNQIEFQGRSFAGVSVSNYGVVEKGDIVYTKSPLKLNPYGIIKTNRINNGIVSTLYAIYKTKENCDSKFIEHYFNLDSRLNQYLKPLVNKGAKNDMKVSSENALVGEVCFPQITEQAMIADLLDRLDTYITLHQRKLEHLQLQKKALLQQLFI